MGQEVHTNELSSVAPCFVNDCKRRPGSKIAKSPHTAQTQKTSCPTQSEASEGEAVRAEADAALEAESVKHLLVPQVYDDYAALP